MVTRESRVFIGIGDTEGGIGEYHHLPEALVPSCAYTLASPSHPDFFQNPCLPCLLLSPRALFQSSRSPTALFLLFSWLQMPYILPIIVRSKKNKGYKVLWMVYGYSQVTVKAIVYLTISIDFL
jgi:hypothetical protein